MIWSIISYERIVRMENITSLESDRSAYEYLPVDVYNTVLERLTSIPPPKYNDTLFFQVQVRLELVIFRRFHRWSLQLSIND